MEESNMTTDEDADTVTGDVVAEPYVTEDDVTAVLFTYTDIKQASHSTLSSDAGRYKLVREAEDHTGDESTVTGEKVSEALVDETDRTGIELTHLDLTTEEASTRQFSNPGVYKLIRTPLPE